MNSFRFATVKLFAGKAGCSSSSVVTLFRSEKMPMQNKAKTSSRCARYGARYGARCAYSTGVSNRQVPNSWICLEYWLEVKWNVTPFLNADTAQDKPGQSLFPYTHTIRVSVTTRERKPSVFQTTRYLFWQYTSKERYTRLYPRNCLCSTRKQERFGAISFFLFLPFAR